MVLNHTSAAVSAGAESLQSNGAVNGVLKPGSRIFGGTPRNASSFSIPAVINKAGETTNGQVLLQSQGPSLEVTPTAYLRVPTGLAKHNSFNDECIRL